MKASEHDSTSSSRILSLPIFDKAGILKLTILSPSFLIIIFRIFLLAPLTISTILPLTGEAIFIDSLLLS